MRFNADAGATYKRFDDGSFGVWTDVEYKVGQKVTVTSRAGKTKLEKLVELVWTDHTKLWLWKIEQEEDE